MSSLARSRVPFLGSSSDSSYMLQLGRIAMGLVEIFEIYRKLTLASSAI